MPRYFFDVRDRREAHTDREGVELLDLDEAREQADAIVMAMARDARADTAEWQWMCDVRDASGMSFYRATFSIRLDRTHLPQ